jgi:hypothetical protein
MRRGVWALLSSVGFAEVCPAQGAGAPGAGRLGGQAKVPPPTGFAPRLPSHGSCFWWSLRSFPVCFRVPDPFTGPAFPERARSPGHQLLFGHRQPSP